MVVSAPVFDQGDIDGAPCAARTQVERSGGPKESDAIGCVVSVERRLFKERLHKLWKLKLLIIIRERLLALREYRK